MPRIEVGEVTEAMVASLERMDMSWFVDLFARDAVFEYPFGWLGAPSRLAVALGALAG